MDRLADMLTIIRNGNMKSKEYVDIPSSKLKQNVVKILKEEGFIKGFKNIENNKQGIIRVYLKYGPNKEKLINNISRVSKPSRRVYSAANEMPKLKSGLGVRILTTSKGVMTDKTAKEQKIGGEILCQIW
ncbi:MAG: 30S ribosomal protein S8 [bacterium]